MFELWDRDSGNRIGSFAKRGQALAAVRAARDRNGPTAAAQLALGRIDDEGNPIRIATGDALLRLLDEPSGATIRVRAGFTRTHSLQVGHRSGHLMMSETKAAHKPASKPLTVSKSSAASPLSKGQARPKTGAKSGSLAITRSKPRQKSIKQSGPKGKLTK